MWLTFHRLLRALSGTNCGKTPRRPRVATLRPRLETLEERTLLSNYTAGTVTDLIGDINAANTAGGTNTITLTAAASSPYILDNTTGALPEITANDNLTINTNDAANRTIERSSSASAFRLFTVDSGASLTLQNLTLTGGWADTTSTNLAESGGAILNAGILAINNCTLADNTAGLGGGGIYNIGTANVSNSTLANNTATLGAGGGIDNDASSTVNLYNCTLANNAANDGFGGGICNGASDTANFYNCTLADNYALIRGGGIANFGACQLGNSIVAENPAYDADIYGNFTSQGHNLIGSQGVDSTGFTNGINGDIVGTGANLVDPMLAGLGNYGGPTQTMALLPGSPAIDAGNNALIPSGVTTDQRGQPRIVNGTVDIGAFESQGFTIIATSGSAQSTADNANFPYALTVTVTANNPLEPVDGGVVTFASPNSGASAKLSASPYFISSGSASANITIGGGSASVSAGANATSGSYMVTASITGTSAPVDFSLTNGPPTAIITTNMPTNMPLATDTSGNWTSPEGSPIFLTGDSFLDPNGTDLPSGITFTWSVTKNGAAYQSGTGQQYWFIPDDHGTYVVTLAVADKDGSGSVSQTIDVTSALTAHIRTPAGFTAEPAGALDPNFGTGGQLSTQTTGYNIGGNVLAEQPDGKIVSAGYVYINQEAWYLAIARYLPDGTPDAGFGQNGVVVTDLGYNDTNLNSVNGVFVQPDGKILVVANSNYGAVLVRLNSDGTLDTSFGSANTGIVYPPVSFSPTTVALQGDNILVAGIGTGNSFVVARLTAAGTLDPTFGTDGTATVQFQPTSAPEIDRFLGATAMAVQGGQIYLAGYADAYSDKVGFEEGFFVVARLDANGNLDTSYGGAAPQLVMDWGDTWNQLATPGWAFVDSSSEYVTNPPTAMLVQSDGQALVSTIFGLYQFSADGRTAAQVGPAASNIIAQPDGKLLLAGLTYDDTNGYSSILTRLNPDLTPDTTFGLNGDGQVVLSQSHSGWIQPTVSSVFLQSDGNVVAAMDLNDSNNNSVGSSLTRILGQATPGQVIHEGDTVTLNGTAFDPAAAEEPTLAYAWSVTKDGAAYRTATGTTYQFTPTDSGTYVVTLTVTDKGGGTSSDSKTFQVNDAPPTSVQIVNPSITSTGQVSFSASVIGPSTGDQAAGYSYTINWGDGTAATNVAATANNGNGSLVLPSHTYAAAGIYTITLTATEDGGQSKSTTALVVVSTAAGDSISVSGGGSSGQVAITTTDEGSFSTTTAPDQVLAADSGGSDTYTVNFSSNLTTPITITGNGATSGTSVDTLVVNGDNSSTNVINKTPGQITWGNPVTETVYRSGIANTTINANGTQTNYINDPGGSTTINGGPGANFVTITATTGSGVAINGGPASNTYTVDLGSLAGPVAIQNSNKGTTDDLIVNGASGNNSIAVTGNQVTAGTQTITDSATLANLTLVGGSGTNTYTINAGSTVNIVAGTGDNILNVNGGKVAGITTPSGVTAPIVFADNYSMLDNGKLTVSASSGVLANDLSTNGQPLTAVLATGPAHGTLTLNADGSFVYTPSANFVGSDSFTYQAKGSDGSLSALATVTIQVSYKFSGFLPPLGNGLAFAVNRTIPIKFTLSDYNGNAVTSLSAVSSLQIQALDANGNPVGAPFNPSSTNNQGLQFSGGQYQFNWQTKGLSAGSYEIVLKLADGTTQTKTIKLTAGGSSAGLVTDGTGGTTTAGALLGGEVDLYVDNSNGDLTSDELARINDAVTSIDATIAPYGVTIVEVSDPTQANVTLNMNTTSSLGGAAQGVLGCTTDADQVTMIQGWNWYAGADPTQVGSGQYDFETAVTHELGHVLGLGHSSDSTSVMYATLAAGTANRNLVTADLNVPDADSGPCALRAVPIADVNNPSNGQGLTAPGSTSIPSSGSPLSQVDQLFTNFVLLLSDARNAYQSALSSQVAMWQTVDALALQRLDGLLSLEAGALGITRDTMIRNLLFARE